MGCTLECIGIDIVVDKLADIGTQMEQIDTVGCSFVGKLEHIGWLEPETRQKIIETSEKLEYLDSLGLLWLSA